MSGSEVPIGRKSADDEARRMNRQLALFSRRPLSDDDIDGATALAATFDLFADHLRADGKKEHTVNAFLGDMRLLAQYAGGELPIGQL